MDLAAPSKRLPSHRTDPRRSASHGIRSRCVPRRRHTCRRPLPGDVSATVRPTCCQAPGHVPPSWFLTTSTVYSARQAPGLLHPEAKRGSLRFTVRSPPGYQPKPVPRGSRPTPRNAVHTPQRIPLAGSRSTSPWPLPSCRSDAHPTALAPKRSSRPTARAARLLRIASSPGRSRVGCCAQRLASRVTLWAETRRATRGTLPLLRECTHHR
jgi:hypothetical protein